MSATAEATSTTVTPERVTELLESLTDVRERVRAAYSSVLPSQAPSALIAVSKYKPASDILACFESGNQLDFGENYVQELVEKSEVVCPKFKIFICCVGA